MKYDHVSTKFSNGQFVIESGKTYRVKAVERSEHGDWKTQMVRKTFMGMEKDEVGTLKEVWNNWYGEFARVIKEDGSTCDIQPFQLEYLCESTIL